jgi:peptidoglycan/LPS O-acetylase OafA/YrhL
MQLGFPMPVKSLVEVEPSINPHVGKFYIPALDGLRAVAFILVFLGHAGFERYVPGGFGVTVFFFLSGYLITTLLRIESGKTGTISLKNFYIRRCRRILPPMYITLGLAYALGYLGFLATQGTLRGAFAAVFYYANYLDLLSNKTYLPSGMGLVWSLMIEEHFYLLFPLTYFIFLRKRWDRQRQTYILLILCGIALFWRCLLVTIFHVPILPGSAGSSGWTYIATDARFDAILWGCILAIASNPWLHDAGNEPMLERHKGVLALSGLALIFFTLVWRNGFFRETVRYSLQSAALYPVFFYCIAARSSWVARLLDLKALREIGNLSYAMYLIHYLLLQSIGRYVHLGRFAVGVIAFGLSLGYAMLMRTLVEDPIRKMVRRVAPKSA